MSSLMYLFKFSVRIFFTWGTVVGGCSEAGDDTVEADIYESNWEQRKREYEVLGNSKIYKGWYEITSIHVRVSIIWTLKHLLKCLNKYAITRFGSKTLEPKAIQSVRYDHRSVENYQRKTRSSLDINYVIFECI